jgi:hypothetical protein
MTDVQYDLITLRVSLARIAQACGPGIEMQIPGVEGRVGMPFQILVQAARNNERGWNKLAALITRHCENNTKQRREP